MDRLDKLLEAFWSDGNITSGQGRWVYSGGKRVFIPAFEEQEHPRGEGGKFTGKPKISTRAEHVKDERVKETPLKIDKPVQTTMSIQKHMAERAGEHRDLRIKINDKAASWVVPHGIPNVPGKPRLAIQQPEHEVDYMKFSGCFPYNTTVITEDGPLAIRDIVENKYQGKAYSYNKDTNQIELNKITGHFINGAINEWISILYSYGMSGHATSDSIKCTPNHIIYTQDGPKNAGALTINDKLLLAHVRIDNNQLSMIYGAMLGDSCIVREKTRRTDRLCFCHSIKQGAYLNYKISMLKNCCCVGVPRINHGSGFSNKDFVMCRISHPIFNQIFNEFYITKHNRKYKTIPDKIEQIIDWSMLSFWYMDDGSLLKHHKKNDGSYHPSIRLHTQGFDIDDNKKLVAILNRKFGLKVNICKSNGFGNMLTINGNDAKIFLMNTAIYAPDCMQYKFGEYKVGNTYNTYTPDNIKQLSPVNITKISKQSFKSRKFDICVDNNHNYFVNKGILVSNSIPSGFGKGRVKVESFGDIDILKWGPNEKKIQVLSGKKKGVYTLKRTDKNNWMIIKHKDGKNLRHYKLVPARKKLKKEMWTDPTYVAELKRDGARYAMEIGEDGTKVISVRKSVSGKVLDRSANVPQISYELKSKEYAGTVLDTEIFHDKGHSTLGGIMNSLPEKARETQKQIGNAKYEVFDILRYKGVDVTDKPYSERRALIEKLNKEINLPITQKFEINKYEKDVKCTCWCGRKSLSI